LDTLNEFQAEALVYLQAHTFLLGDTLGNVGAKVLVDALADTLLEVEPETLKNALALVMSEALIAALPRGWQKTGQREGRGTGGHTF